MTMNPIVDALQPSVNQRSRETDQDTGGFAMHFSLLTMLFAATGAFAGLQRLTQYNLGVRPLPGLGLGVIACYNSGWFS
jgi:hypothetical protein